MPLTSRNWKNGGIATRLAHTVSTPYLVGATALAVTTNDVIAASAINLLGPGGTPPEPGDVLPLQGASPFVNGTVIDFPCAVPLVFNVQNTAARLAFDVTGKNQFGEDVVEHIVVGDGTLFLFNTRTCWTRITEMKFTDASNQTASLLVGLRDLHQNITGGAGLVFPLPARGASVLSAFYSIRLPHATSGTTKVAGPVYPLTVVETYDDAFAATGIVDASTTADVDPYTIVDLHTVIDSAAGV